jgi:hypothetical protein
VPTGGRGRHSNDGRQSSSLDSSTMAQITLPGDFKEFLRLLGARGVEYLLVGGYAVGHHGYPRYTADIDVWVPIDMGNAERLTTVLRDFGFDMPEVNPELFLRERMIIRMGVPPMRIEIINHIDGVEFPACYARRVVVEIDEVPVNIIALDDLKVNKRASGRLKDLADLENLP